MPIYEYRCRTCKKNFEVLQKISEKPLMACPTCGKKVKRLISRTSFTLKGGGWYKDGYASSSGGKPAEPTKENKPAEPAKESKPAEKKPEKTPPTKKD